MHASSLTKTNFKSYTRRLHTSLKANPPKS